VHIRQRAPLAARRPSRLISGFSPLGLANSRPRLKALVLAAILHEVRGPVLLAVQAAAQRDLGGRLGWRLGIDVARGVDGPVPAEVGGPRRNGGGIGMCVPGGRDQTNCLAAAWI
jgi:hypothetical protein